MKNRHANWHGAARHLSGWWTAWPQHAAGFVKSIRRLINDPPDYLTDLGQLRRQLRLDEFEIHAPTAIVAAIIYGGWLLITAMHGVLPWFILIPAGAILVAWHSSLQHEAVHGLIAQPRWLNDALAWLPLSLWLPFRRYKQTHLIHHNLAHLTDPRRDPESYYIDPKTWESLPPWRQKMLIWHNTFIGRMLIGPWLMIGQFLHAEAEHWREPGQQRLWLIHLLGCLIVIGWLWLWGFNIISYILCFVIPATSLGLVRSFAEHKARETPEERTAVIEEKGFWALLFLNNNLHFAHHKRPQLRWTELPDYYARHKRALLEENGGLIYIGYGEVIQRYWRQPVDQVAHPHMT